MFHVAVHQTMRCLHPSHWGVKEQSRGFPHLLTSLAITKAHSCEQVIHFEDVFQPFYPAILILKRNKEIVLYLIKRTKKRIKF
ncbi:hypothetical protein H1P_3960001 [Hyella patelloides LEGE 07179]|uniref:Uncharacterized protein n=1 Tax=Hyella patelloides LEGE 07179 TaxID=945734 RepID=A0A563VX52_9CYAN|nr:hypothetical protein H1P_3960001 [Hyella patelloides LEGE 07179]